MRRLLLISALITLISGCGLGPNASELKSPCVSIQSQDGPQAPCTKRSVNNHWIG